MNSKVDEYIQNSDKWQKEMEHIRKMLLECPFQEDFKWRVPCYTFEGSNVVLLSGLKRYCALSFPKGTLLKDANSILIQPGENTQAGRQIRFTNLKEIRELKTVVKSYLLEAIEIEKSGLKIDVEANKELVFPEELLSKFTEYPDLKKAFNSLSPGRQRGYNLYFSAPKQSKTRTSRIEKYMEKILKGFGFHDCTCGLSKRMPSCDGSHKYNQ